MNQHTQFFLRINPLIQYRGRRELLVCVQYSPSMAARRTLAKATMQILSNPRCTRTQFGTTSPLTEECKSYVLAWNTVAQIHTVSTLYQLLQ